MQSTLFRQAALILTSIMFLTLVVMPAAAQNEFTYTTNNDAITITGYVGPGGDVVIPSEINGFPVRAIKSRAFDQRTTITSVEIPEGVTFIGNHAFYHCFLLTKINIPSSATTLGGWSFCSCRSLTEAKIAEGITSINDWQFFWCTSLTQFNIPDSVTSIARGAFYNCSGLANVTVGKNVASIAPEAFAFCENLEGIFFTGNAPMADPSIFSGDSKVVVYYLPGTSGWGSTFCGRPTMLWNPEFKTRQVRSAGRDVQFGITITGTPNIPIVLETRALTSRSWSPLLNLTLTNGIFHYAEPDSAKQPGRLYRVRWP